MITGTLVSQSKPRRCASSFHLSLYPLPSNRMSRHSPIYFLITVNNARSLASPCSIRLSTSCLNIVNCSATVAFRANTAAAQLALEPTARNSNLFHLKRLPVKANGEVRLRSVLSSKISGIFPTPSFISFFALMMIPLSTSAFSI